MSTASSGPITALEVAEWFQQHRRPWPDADACAPIAAMLVRLAREPWTDDERDAAINAAIARRYAAAGVAVPAAKPEPEPPQWWDFKSMAAAAETLLAAIPLMREHWRKLEWAPETRGGTAAMDALSTALTVAMPFIEYPFGEYARTTGRKEPKSWHMPAVLVLPTILRAMMDAGHKNPGLARDSVAIAVLHQGLSQIGLRGMAMMTPTALAAHLRRWRFWKGLTTKQIAALCGDTPALR